MFSRCDGCVQILLRHATIRNYHQMNEGVSNSTKCPLQATNKIPLGSYSDANSSGDGAYAVS